MKGALGSLFSVILALAAVGALMAYSVAEEIPVGGFEGTTLMSENGRALANATVRLDPVDTLDEALPSRSTVTEADGSFTLRNLRSGLYTLSVSGKAHRMEDKRPILIEEGRPTERELHVPPIDPYMDLYASQRVVVPGEAPTLQIKGFVDAKSLEVTAFRLNFDQVAAEESLYSALAPLAATDKRAKDPGSMGMAVTRTVHTLTNRDAEGTFIETVQTESLPEGLYWIQCRAGGLTRGTWFSVTRIALVVKQAGKDATCWVTRIDTGEPVSGVIVRAKGTASEPQATDARGLATLHLPGAEGYSVITASLGESRALVDLYVDEEGSMNVRTCLYTERPVYRPGDEIHFKGIVRKLVDGDYSLPQSAPVHIQFEDPDGMMLDEVETNLGEMGSFVGRFQLSREAEPGYYTITSRVFGETQTLGVSVAAYRKPAYSVTVTPEHPSYVRGDQARVKVKVEYFYGGPVAGAKIEASLFKGYSWDPRLYGEDYEQWMEDDAGYYGGEYLRDLQGVTDANGEATFVVDTADGSAETDSDFVYQLSASAVDDSGFYFTGTGSFRVVRGEFSAYVATDSSVVDPGAKVPVEVKVVSNRPEVSLAGRTVTLTTGYELWNRRTSSFEKVGVYQLTLDSEGRASTVVTPAAPGDFRLRAQLQDDRGNTISNTAYLWVVGQAGRPTLGEGRLSLQLDRKQYKKGEWAKVVVGTSEPGGQALLTLETDRVVSTQLLRLDGESTTVEVPVSEELLPNAYVSVAYVRSGKFAEATKMLRVDNSSRLLTVSVTADRDRYLPGEDATFTVETRKPSGEPVAADCSLAVVDESVYAISEDSTSLEGAFYPRRYNQVRTYYSFPELYLDGGDKAPTSIQVRRKFKDTAYWSGTVTTDSQGRATVRVTLPDNLTSWRATVHAADRDTHVGKGVLKVLARKPLMVRLESSRHFVVGDEQALKALITNDSGADADVRLNLEAQGTPVEGGLQRSERVRQGETLSVAWVAKPTASGTATFVAKAWIEGGANDGVELRVPVNAHGRRYVDRLAGSAPSGKEISLTVREGSDPNTGGLDLVISPSLASVFVQSLDGLLDYPYGCVEQTMSRVMPAVVVSQAIRQAGLPPPARAGEIPSIVADGIVRLRKMRHSDGGWGWWEYDETDLYMTAYVLEGLHLMRPLVPLLDLGDDRDIQTLRTLLRAELPKDAQPYQARLAQADRAYAAYVLSLHGDAGAATAHWASQPVAQDGAEEAAFRVLTGKVTGRPDLVTPGVARLKELAHKGTALTWDGAYWGSEASARALQALVAVGDLETAAGAVRGLVAGRRGSGWWSTRDTSTSLLALTRYWTATGELELSGSLVALLNGQELVRLTLSKDLLSRPETRIHVPANRLRPGSNTLVIRRSDGKPCAYSAELAQVVAQEQLAPVVNASKLTVKKEFFRMRVTRLEDGTNALRPEKAASTTFQAGDLIRCVVSVDTPNDLTYVVVEDMLPAGFEVTEREDLPEYESWNFWFSKIVVRDDRIAFFATSIPKGRSEFSYHLRAEGVGEATALPALASLMYDPDQFASSGGLRLEVRP